jgi:hypothetical protein
VASVTSRERRFSYGEATGKWDGSHLHHCPGA